MVEQSKIIEHQNLRLTKKSKTNFLYSTFFLNKEKSKALQAVYSFCRISDDIVDEEGKSLDMKVSKFLKWKEDFQKALDGKSDNYFLNYLVKIILRYNLDKSNFFFLLDGMEMDLTKNRYNNFDELYNYCYCVASTVGLIFIKILSYKNEVTIDYAINLGIALQLTNILRDLKQDAMEGRIYLPLEDLEKYHYSENNLIGNIYNDKFIELMKYEIDRTESFYNKARSNLTKPDFKTLLSARIIDKTYFSILKQIEKSRYNVYTGNLRISKFRKLMIPFLTLIQKSNAL